MASVVYAVHPVKDIDVSPAEHWGKLVFINPRYVYPDEIDEGAETIPDSYRNKLETAAAAFTHDDYLLIVGDHLQLVYFSALLGGRFTKFRVLRYIPSAKGYMPVNITCL